MRSVSPALVILVAALASGCSVPVAAALDESDANRVIVALDQSGIVAMKEIDPTVEGKFRVTVAKDDVAQALTAMREEELPRPKPAGVLDAADRGQLVPSQAAEHAQLVAGFAGELEKTLGSVDGVLSARVHLNVPTREPLRDGPGRKATASVLVEHRGAAPPLAAEPIQRLVAGGAPGVEPSDVAVVFVPRAARASAARADLGHVGPIVVARSSMSALKIVFASLAVALLGFAAATLVLWSRATRLGRELVLATAQATARAAYPSQEPPNASARPGPPSI